MNTATKSLAAKSAGSDQLLSFIQYLRGKKIPVSPADTLLAFKVVGIVGYRDKNLLRDGLAAALAKSMQELEDFEDAFEQYFQIELKTRDESFSVETGQSGFIIGADGSFSLQPSTRSENPLSKLRENPLFRILDQGDKGALATSIEKAAAEAEGMCIGPASAATVTLVLAYSARTFPYRLFVYLEWFSLCDSC